MRLSHAHIGCRAIDCQPAAAPGLVDHIKLRIKRDVGDFSPFSPAIFFSFSPSGRTRFEKGTTRGKDTSSRQLSHCRASAPSARRTPREITPSRDAKRALRTPLALGLIRIRRNTWKWFFCSWRGKLLVRRLRLPRVVALRLIILEVFQRVTFSPFLSSRAFHRIFARQVQKP